MNQIQAYECPGCLTLHRLESAAQDCLKVHQDEEEEQARKEEEQRRRLAEKDFIRLNLTNLHDFPTMLEQQAERFGFEVKITSFYGEVKAAKPEQFTHSRPIDRIDAIKHLAWFRGHIGGEKAEEDYRDRSVRNFYDFLQYEVRGLHTGTGCGGSKRWQYELTLHLSDFPHLHSQYVTYLGLKEKHEAHLIKRKHLEAEYEEYYQWKKFADIFWLVHELERKDLLARIKEIESNLRERATELDDERFAKTYLEPDYDSNLYHILSENLIRVSRC